MANPQCYTFNHTGVTAGWVITMQFHGESAKEYFYCATCKDKLATGPFSDYVLSAEPVTVAQ